MARLAKSNTESGSTKIAWPRTSRDHPYHSNIKSDVKVCNLTPGPPSDGHQATDVSCALVRYG